MTVKPNPNALASPSSYMCLKAVLQLILDTRYDVILKSDYINLFDRPK